MNWTLVSAVNNQALLESCLLRSPDASTAREVLLQRGFSSAAAAYNAAIDQATTDILVFAHQDVFLPQGWQQSVAKTLARLQERDPNWAVLGVWGVNRAGVHYGHVYCGGSERLLGQEFGEPQEVRSLDELLLIIRKSSGVRFDERMGGFHFYGTDVCLEAEKRGLKSYAISAFCVHNTNGYRTLPWQFWRIFLQMRRKWRRVLPVTTSCIEITPGCLPALKWNFVRAINLMLGRHKVGKRCDDPAQLYRHLQTGGKLPQVASASAAGVS